jgi:hypothetical protein
MKRFRMMAAGLAMLAAQGLAAPLALAGGNFEHQDFTGTWKVTVYQNGKQVAVTQMGLSVGADNRAEGMIPLPDGSTLKLKGLLMMQRIPFTFTQNGALGTGMGVIDVNGSVFHGEIASDRDPVHGAQLQLERISPNLPSAAPSAGAPITQIFPTAKNDVDVYSGPGGKYKVIGMMRKGAAAPSITHHVDGWCKLRGVGPNGADGWVADDHLTGCL